MERSRSDFGERIRHALARFPGAFPADEGESSPPRELATFGDADDVPRQEWPPQPHRPDGYPDDIPFVTDARMLVVRRPGPPIMIAIWSEYSPDRPVFADVTSHCLHDGWTPTEITAPGPNQSGPCRLLIKDREARFVWSLDVKGREEVILMQVPRGPAATR